MEHSVLPIADTYSRSHTVHLRGDEDCNLFPSGKKSIAELVNWPPIQTTCSSLLIPLGSMNLNADIVVACEMIQNCCRKNRSAHWRKEALDLPPGLTVVSQSEAALLLTQFRSCIIVAKHVSSQPHMWYINTVTHTDTHKLQALILLAPYTSQDTVTQIFIYNVSWLSCNLAKAYSFSAMNRRSDSEILFHQAFLLIHQNNTNMYVCAYPSLSAKSEDFAVSDVYRTRICTKSGPFICWWYPICVTILCWCHSYQGKSH